MLPHLGEITMILIIALMIFGVGRLPHISRAIARSQVPPADPPPPSSAPSPDRETEDAQVR